MHKYNLFKVFAFLLFLLILYQIYYVKILTDRFYYQVETQRKNELKQKVDMAYNAILPIIELKKQKKISKEEAIKSIAEIVRRMTYQDEYAKNYIFMSSYEGTYIVQPFEREKEGKNFWNYKDINGTYVIRELVKAAKEHPQGSFVSYYLAPPGSSEHQLKLSYVRGIPEIDAYIGTGMYVQNTFKVMFKLLFSIKSAIYHMVLFTIILFISYIYKLNVDYRRLMEEMLKRKALFENSPDALVEFDKTGLIADVNESFEKLFGFKKEECIKKNIDDLITDEKSVIEARSISKQVFQKGFCNIETVRFNKEKKPINVLIRSILIKINGHIQGGYGIYTDITTQKKYEKELEYLSYHDTLTGLYNFRYFQNYIKNIDDRQLPIGIIMADVNGLKLVNDTLGHLYGDKLLISFSKILLESKRDKDIVFRLGGDEFLVLLPNTEKEQVEKILNEIRQNIEKHNESIGEKILTLSVALGMAVKDDGRDFQTVFKEADGNMYKNKLLDKTSSKNQIINVLMAALGEKDYVTKGHIDRVKGMVQRMAEKLNLGEVQKNNLLLLADMHDLGKVAISDDILNKREPLTEEEWEVLKSHPEKGYRIAVSSPELAGVADLILKHHERWDGKGYPLGLKGEQIPIECRILALADSYDAMTNTRPYNKVKTHAEAIEEIKRCSGTQFDPKIVDVFLEIFQ
ncbi:MAG: cache domain-containing protein [Caloramator sp.]|nr:cache domain-containing protein [Caloramator sp.]